MPAAVVKGILITVSLITALSVAVLENPQVQVWLEEQRQKIAELLRSLGEELDPESRRVAEAFAYEGKTPATDAGLRREASGSKEAAAVATGRSMSSSNSTVRRIPIGGPSDPNEAEERRRKGREYLAKRNQQLHELQEKRTAAAQLEGTVTSPSPSFDAMVDREGKLKGLVTENSMALPVPPSTELVGEKVEQEELASGLVQPLLAAGASSSLSGYHLGSQLADPFGDEYAMERSLVLKPPVPPKLALDAEESERTRHEVPSVVAEAQQYHAEEHADLSFEEQMAIALSLSEAESSANTATVRQSQPEPEDEELRAAIQASLREMDDQQAAHAVAHAEPLTPQVTSLNVQSFAHSTPSRLTIPDERRSETDDELYCITPELTRARLATFDAQQPIPTPYDPVHEGTESHSQPPRQAMEASFYSTPSIASPPPSGEALQPQTTPDVVNAPQEVPATPASDSSSSAFDSDSGSEAFASVLGSRAQSQARSEASGVEVVDVLDDSDDDLMFEEGDGIRTPDSWTEVGSEDGEESESETGEAQPQTLANL